MPKTEDDWIGSFGEPLENAEGSSLFETFGADIEAVRAVDERRVWSVLEGSDSENQYLVPGFQIVNLLGYVIAAREITDEEIASKEWDEVLWVDHADFGLPTP